jgi:hypothetical protein
LLALEALSNPRDAFTRSTRPRYKKITALTGGGSFTIRLEKFYIVARSGHTLAAQTT